MRCPAEHMSRVIAHHLRLLCTFTFSVFVLFSIWSTLAVASFGQTIGPAPGMAEETRAKSDREASTATAGGTVAPESAIDLRSLEKRLKQALTAVTPAVVSVNGGGSGVVVSEDGFVLTVAHVGMRAGRRVRAIFPSGRRAWGTTLGNDRGVDAGMIKLDGDGPYPHVTMGVSEGLESGAWCMALGYPISFESGRDPVVRIGRLLRMDETSLITDCTIMGGDSGGPLFDADGVLIGVSSRCNDRLTFNIHVPIDCFNEHWDRLARSEDFNSQTRGLAYLGVAPDEGVSHVARIGTVFPGTPAAKSGIKVGDVLLKFNGKELSKYADLPPLIRRHKPGDTVLIELERGEETIKIQVALGDRD